MKPEQDRIFELKNLSHDLQNILSAIVNNAKLLKQQTGLPNESLKFINIIENNSLRAAEIIQEFLSNKKTQKRKIGVLILFDDITSSFVNLLPQNIQFNFNCSVNEFSLFGNYTELFRAFLNLLINAKEAVKENGSISFEANQTPDKQILFRVKDNGCGIEPAEIKNIFNPGFSTKNKGRESGMGLNIVKNIIEDHKGSIEVSSGINEGTEFKIFLPLFKESISEFYRNKKILIADDDDSLRESLADLFESYGFVTLQANDGNAVIDLIKKEKKIDLLLIDKNMSGKDGLKCISEIRIFDKKLPIVLVTGANFEEAELEEINSKFFINNIIKKPYDFDYLKEIVESLTL